MSGHRSSARRTDYLKDDSLRKHCNFCGEPMLPDAKECKQCGWDVSQDAPPTTDPGDRKARIGVAAGLVVAYAMLWSLVQSAPAEDLPAPTRSNVSARAEPVAEPVTQAPVTLGTLPAVVAST